MRAEQGERLRLGREDEHQQVHGEEQPQRAPRQEGAEHREHGEEHEARPAERREDERRGDRGRASHHRPARREHGERDQDHRQQHAHPHRVVAVRVESRAQLGDVRVTAAGEVAVLELGQADEAADPCRRRVDGAVPPRPDHRQRVQRAAGRIDPERRRAGAAARRDPLARPQRHQPVRAARMRAGDDARGGGMRC